MAKMITSLVEIFRLNEVRGRIPELDNILDNFKNKLEEKLQDNSLPVTVTLKNEDLWTESSFFNNIQVRVSVKQGLFTKATGELHTTNLRIVDGKLNWILITLNVVWDPKDSLDEVVDKTSSDFSHEITHAFEEYERLKRGAPSLGARDFQTQYSKLRKNAQNTLEYVLKSVLYFTNKVEQKAFLAEFYSEAKRVLSSDKSIQSANDLYKKLVGSEVISGKKSFEIKEKAQSQAGQSYQACRELVWLWNGGIYKDGKTIYQRADEQDERYREMGDESNWRKELVETWNDIYGTHVESVGDVQIKLNRIWNKFEPVFKTKLGKIVHDVWNSKEK